MPFLDFLQSLPLPILCAVTVALSLLAGWLILGGVRVTLRLRGWDPAKPINVPELATITSVLFALLLRCRRLERLAAGAKCGPPRGVGIGKRAWLGQRPAGGAGRKAEGTGRLLCQGGR